MTVKTLLARPVVWALANSDGLVLFATVLLVALPTGRGLLGLGLTSAAAILSALPVAIAAALGAGLWWVSPAPGRRSCHDVALESADRVADWAGWPVIELDPDES
ncbi:hypothetical protein ACFVIY_42400 [Streptomyces sp. NPDC127166]|uniref:hypothetical protein n=1 Tax=Streptomyces sp. NPDC127166 TaxID=3345380 RepID=UPI003624F009